jgi:hypothetical protein
MDEATGKLRVYELTDQEAMQIAHGAIVRSFPGRKIETIDGPTRGYSTYTRVVLDTFTQQIIVNSVIGTKADGRTVDGYTFEISGYGTSGSGAFQNTAFFNTLKSDLSRTGRGVDVASIQARRIASMPVTATASDDPIERLRRLSELHQQGAITNREYEEKRAELLRRI